MNIYVNNLDQKITDEQIKQLFAQYGETSSAEVVMDVFTEQSRGFAYVEMPNDEEGLKAIEHINNMEWEGRVLTAEVAKPKPVHKGSYPVGNGYQKNFLQGSYSQQKKKGFKKR